MIKKEMFIDSVLLNKDKERMLEYKTFAIAFSYPSENFFLFFPEESSKKEEIFLEYDKLFRAGEIWLYGSEYTAENEFQRTFNLSDIMGFYQAFGVEVEKDRPDSLSSELEFMYYLIFKKIYALLEEIKNSKQKIAICEEAEKKFFLEHLYPAAKKIAEKVILQSKNNFYLGVSKKLLDFLESEKIFFRL